MIPIGHAAREPRHEILLTRHEARGTQVRDYTYVPPYKISWDLDTGQLVSARTILVSILVLKGISAEFQVIRGFSQKIPTDLLSYDKIHS